MSVDMTTPCDNRQINNKCGTIILKDRKFLMIVNFQNQLGMKCTRFSDAVLLTKL